ncbi:MAG TPA: SDR family oxidoreductase [Solirubrobacteraceae bacterium]|nr:SDR family oxidoreductase [Solirubrobacteraceae bacterium]
MPNAIVTGGNSGIGRSIAVSLAKAGFDVGFTWRSEEERAQEAVQEIEGHGRRAVAQQADLADGEAGARVIGELADALGSVDVFVSNAGMGLTKPVLELSADDWRGVVEVDLTGAFLCFQEAAKRMVAQGGGGRCIFVTSVHEHIPLRGNAPYTASKHGLGGLVKAAAMELAEHGITVNAVAPGQIATRMTGQEDQEPEPSDGIPLGRAGKADEIAHAVVHLASPGASYTTGASLVVDGGLSLIAADYQ